MAEGNKPETFARWKAEIDHATSDTKYVNWITECDQITKRYRDERDSTGGTGGIANVGTPQATRRFNMLWSNVQVLGPAVYGKMPSPVVQRRFLDKDPVARTASMILERTVMFQMEANGFHETMVKCVLDYLLPGLGVPWNRYEPEFESAEEAAGNAKVQSEETQKDVKEEGDGTPYKRVAYERVCTDYLYFKDFLWSQARGWTDVRWVAKRSFLSHTEIAEQLYDGDLEKAKLITLDWTAQRMAERTGTYNNQDATNMAFVKKAAIWEIWNKPDRTVYFIAPGSPNVGLIKETPDGLKLQNFFPTPEPLFATQTNDTLLPVPDYHEYKDQAQEVDDLTDRIARITGAVKAAGVYDSSIPALQRLLQQGMDNQLIAVDQWAMFAEKGGLKGAVDLLPMKDIVTVLETLYAARERQVAQANQLTGISDIVRGQGEGPAKTATEQRIKGQFATLRLQSRQAQVARFCRDNVRIIAEIAAEHFSEQSLMEMSGYRQIVQDEMQKAVNPIGGPSAGAPSPDPTGQAGGGPSSPPAGLMAPPPNMPMQQQIDPAQAAEQKALDEFAKAVMILRSDKLRGFRVDIETDSTIQIDSDSAKQAATELTTGLLQGLEAAGPVIQMAPELLPLIGKTFELTLRTHRAGRVLESTLDEAMQKLEERLSQPQPPSPEQIKAQAEQQKQQAETQRSVMDFQAAQQQAKDQAALDQQKMGLELQKLQAEMAADREKHAMEMEKMRMQMAAIQQKTNADMAKTAMQAQADERTAEIDSEAREREAELSAEAAEAQHEQKMEAALEKGNGADA